MSHITPQEALRLSKADALARKHFTRLTPGKVYPTDEDVMHTIVDTAELANLIDEVTAAKDATIKALRKEVQDAYRDAEREARDAYSQGQGDEAERHRDNY